VREDESRGLKQKIEKALTQAKLNSKFVLLQTSSEQLADYFLSLTQSLYCPSSGDKKKREKTGMPRS
jgi:hypothetical protein